MLVREFADERPALPDDALVAGFEFFQLLADLVKERRQTPTGDVFSLMVTTEVEDDSGAKRSLSDDQLAARFMELAIAGHETVMKLIATGVVALAWYPDQRRELCASTDLLPNAVEEMVRWIPPSQYQGRWTTRDVELHGTTIPAEQRVLLVTAAATHDEREYDDPDAFDIHRRIDRQLGFGFGAHLCLGAALARLESRIAFEELLRRFPEYEIVEDGVERAFGSNVQGLKHLPITFEPVGA
jgi:cytochrome P450